MVPTPTPGIHLIAPLSWEAKLIISYVCFKHRDQDDVDESRSFGCDGAVGVCGGGRDPVRQLCQSTTL